MSPEVRMVRGRVAATKLRLFPLAAIDMVSGRARRASRLLVSSCGPLRRKLLFLGRAGQGLQGGLAAVHGGRH